MADADLEHNTSTGRACSGEIDEGLRSPFSEDHVKSLFTFIGTSLNSGLRVKIRRRFNSWNTWLRSALRTLARGTPEASITARDGEPQLAAAGQTQPESSPTAVGEQGFFRIEFCQQLRDDSAHPWSVVHPRHQMHHDLLCCDFQHPAALCQL
jgi:hypothetical protein